MLFSVQEEGLFNPLSLSFMVIVMFSERLHNRIHRDKAVVNKYFLSVFVRLFMEKRERPLMRFIAAFQKLNMADEKVGALILIFYN